MRALPVVLVLLAAGCSSLPAPSFAVALTTRADPWTAGWDAAQLAGALGDEVEFRVALSHGAWSAEHVTVYTNERDVRIDRVSADAAPSGRNVTVVGHALLDRDGPIELRLDWWNGTTYGGPGSGDAALPGPAMAPARSGTPLQPATNDSTVPAGFHARREGDAVVVSYATGKEASSSCDEIIGPGGPGELRNESGRAVMVAFAVDSRNDACSPIPPRWPSVQLVASPAPAGSIDVRLVVFDSCGGCFEHPPWHVLTATLPPS